MNTRAITASVLSFVTLCATSAVASDLPSDGDTRRVVAELDLRSASVGVAGLVGDETAYLTPEVSYDWAARSLAIELQGDWRIVNTDGFALRWHGGVGPGLLFSPNELAMRADTALMLDWGSDGWGWSMGPHARGAALVGPPNTARLDLGAAGALAIPAGPARAFVRGEVGYRLGGASRGGVYAGAGLALMF